MIHSPIPSKVNSFIFKTYVHYLKLFLSQIFSDHLFTRIFNLTFSMSLSETPILWPPHAKNWLIGKDPDAGRDWEQEEKGTTEDEMAGWHHQLDGHEYESTPGTGDGQGGLACCDSWGRQGSDTNERLNWTELNWWAFLCPLNFAHTLKFQTNFSLIGSLWFIQWLCIHKANTFWFCSN